VAGLESHSIHAADGESRQVVEAVEGDELQKCLQNLCSRHGGHYPEANVLVPREVDPLSKTPAFKSIIVTIEQEMDSQAASMAPTSR
jgi:hypothetical protein